MSALLACHCSPACYSKRSIAHLTTLSLSSSLPCRFAVNKSLMASKEAKRIVKTYNKVAKALVEFEVMWTQAWINSVENAKAGLQATLIVKHPETGEFGLLVVWPGRRHYGS